MTALAEKLKSAGADTVGARITTLCVEGLRLYQGNIFQAWNHVGTHYGHALLRELAKDMNLPIPPPTIRVAAPRPSTEITLERERLRNIVRSKYKNSAGTAWSDVGWHELSALTRDGKEAAALLAVGPASVPNDGRTVGQVLGIKKTDQIIEAARAQART